MGIKIKFWGVRGSIACPSPNHIVYGGNTTCVEINVDGNALIIDAGTGIRSLGHDFTRRGITSGVLVLTHTHWDHINGFPFFSPAFKPGNSFRIMAGHLTDVGGIQEILEGQMANPMFPVPLATMKAQLTFEDFRAGDTLKLFGGVSVRTAPLNHPNGATAYRVDHNGASVCLVFDTEHIPGQPDKNVLDLIEGADMVIYDSTYNDDEFPAKVGWGHSTWEEGVRLCRAANVKRLVLTHHDPDHEDDYMERLEDIVRHVWDGILIARDNMELTVP